MKKTFNPADFERALESGAFANLLVVSTFTDVFSRYTPRLLVRMPQQTLDVVIGKLVQREDVKQMQSLIQNEIVDGENTLKFISTLIFSQLQKVNIAPLDKGSIYPKPYQEVEAYCNTNGVRVARGLFEPTIQLEAICFSPENTFYSDLPRIFRGDYLVCEHGSSDIRLKRVAALEVFRDLASDEELTKRVKEVIQRTADRLFGATIKSRAKRYKTAEEIIVDDRLYPLFKSVKTDDSINYTKVYKIFEGVVMENIDIGQLNMDPELRRVLREEIEKVVPIPYAVIRRRVKEAESTYNKVIQALYDIRVAGRKDKPKRFRDMLGLRVVVPKVENVYSLANLLEGVVGWEIIDKEDYIKKPKPNGYKSYHMAIKMGPVYYDLQIRTHQMDRDINLNPKQTQDVGYEAKKQAALERKVPTQVKRVVATLLGV